MKLAATLATVVALAGVARADWGPKRDPFDRGVIARYQAILAKDPYDPALTQLAAIYRRYRTIDALIAEYDGKLVDDPNGTVLVIVARLLEPSNPASALATYHRAWSVRPDDPKLALRVAVLERNANHLEEASKAYDRALTGDKPVQREALRGLVDLARSRRDRVAVATHTKKLVELDPKDPKLQLERGDAMLGIELFEAAIEAYATAEKLYATDPIRRIEAIIRRGLALEQHGELGKAETEYRRAMASVPKDHYLRAELFGRLVELHRRGGTLGALLAVSLEDWPVASRGAFEWHELAKLYDALNDQPNAIAALEQAVKRSPEARLHLELADHYPPTRIADKLSLLARLAARSSNDVMVLGNVAERYAKWGHVGLALAAYDKLVRLDPAATDRMIDLVEESFRTGSKATAIALSRNVATRLKTGAAHGRLGSIQLEWGYQQDAVTSYARAITLEPRVAEHYRGRALANDALEEREAAVYDGRRVLDLVGDDPKLRRTARKELVRIVMHASGESGERGEYIDRWRDAFAGDPPDVESGLLLLDYFGIAPCDHWINTKRSCDGEVARLIVRLSRFGPLDADDVIGVATAYSAAGRHEEAIQILETLRKLAPDREIEVIGRIGKINQWRMQVDPYAPSPFSREDIQDPEREIRATVRRHRREIIHEIEEPLRIGLKLGYGNGLRGGGDTMLSGGVQAAASIGRDMFITLRFDLAKRDEFSSAGGSIGIAKALVTTRSTALVFGIAERLERRWGVEMMRSGYGATGLSADATLDLVGINLPAALGARLQQGMSDDGRSTALMFEATVEFR